MYVVIGASGYLGAYLIQNILKHTTDSILALARCIGPDYGKRVQWAVCDITQESDIAALNESHLRKNRDNKIIYLAAYHHPDLVEKNPRLAWDTNITSLSRFLNVAENVKCLFYPSTDSVYGESYGRHHFTEQDALNPVNRYGIQKSVAEKLVTGYGHHVVRFPFLIAPSLVPTKKHFYDIIAEALLAGKPFEMFSDSYRSAISFDTAAELTVKLIESGKVLPQILNVCGDEDLSKYDIGIRIAETLGVDRSLIVPISIESPNGVFSAKRAASTLMDNTLLKNILGIDSIKLVI